MQTRLPFDENIPGPYGDWGVARPLSHTFDPSTSHAAEASIRASGALKTHEQQVARLVARWPNWTASELTQQALIDYPNFKEMGFDKALIEVRRRLSSMRGIHVERSEIGRMGLLKKSEVTWKAK